MAKKYMPQRVFNYGAATIAQLHLGTEMSIEELAAQFFLPYCDAYTDDGVEQDWIDVAQQATELLIENNIPHPEGFLHHFSFYIEHYEPDGSPRKKKVLSGTWSNQEERNLQRKEDFIRQLIIYYAEVMAGKAPLAPPERR